MNKASFEKLIHQPELINKDATNELQEIVNMYPYFQTAHLLHLKGLHNENSLRFESTLKTTAIYAGNRELLYYLVLQSDLQTKIKTIETEVEQEEALPQSEQEVQNTENNLTEESPKVTEQKESIEDLEQQILEQAISASIAMDVDEISPATTAVEKKEPVSEVKEEVVENLTPKSFSSWLKQTSDYSEPPPPSEHSIDTLIDQFIATQPQISSAKTAFFSPSNVAKMSLVDNEDFVTETLAKIYVKQGNYDKAISVFKKLSLNFPEKSAYFADQINSIEELKNK